MNQFTEGQEITIYVTNIIDAQGHPATLLEPVVWRSSVESILTLTPSSDGLSATGVCETTGQTMVTATSGTVTDSIAITVGHSGAVAFTLVAQASDAPAPGATTA